MKKLSALMLSLLVIASFFLSACSSAPVITPAPTEPSAENSLSETTAESSAPAAETSSSEAANTEAAAAADGSAKTQLYPELNGNEAIQEVLPADDGSYGFQGLKVDDWQAFLKAQDKPVLLDFWATWCGPCMAASPLIDKIARAYGDRIRVFKINVDYAQDIFQQYGFDGIPVFIVLNKGEVQKSWLGAENENFSAIQETLDGLLK